METLKPQCGVLSLPCCGHMPCRSMRGLRIPPASKSFPSSAQLWTKVHTKGRNSTPRRNWLTVRAEISYVMVKPDGVQRALVGEIVSRFERKGFTLKALKMFVPSRDTAEEHYKDLSSKPFFNDLVSYIISGPVVAMVNSLGSRRTINVKVWEGDGVVASARKLIGATNPLNAEPGTIRGDFAVQTGRNVVHGSDSPENGERETALWFGGKEDITQWTPALKDWLRE